MSSWVKLDIPALSEPKPKAFNVFLYRAPKCIRGWLAYRKADSAPTLKVKVMALDGQKAKNAAITAANNEFEGVEILHVGFNTSIWGAQNFPELWEIKTFREFVGRDFKEVTESA